MRLRSQVFNTLIKVLNNYQYCILRNYEILPEYNNDIDILIEDYRKYEAIKKLDSSFLPLGVKLLQVVEFSSTAVFFYDTVNEQFLHIDFLSNIKWRVFSYLDADKILATRVRYKNIYIPDNDYEFLELLLTRLIYQGKIKEKYKDKIFELSLNIVNKKNSKFYKFLIEKARKKEWHKIEKRIFSIRLFIILNNIKNPIHLSKNIFSFIKRIILRISKKPGLFVVFYGVDGSGKSTQIKLLTEKLRGFYSQKILLFHFRPRIIYSKPKDIIVNNPHHQKDAHYLRSILKLFYYVLIYNWGYFTQVLPMLAKNGLVIFDRYYFDMIIDPVRYRLNIPEWYIKLFSRFIPKPDINFCLFSEPHIILSRKQEINLAELIRQQDRILILFEDKISHKIRSDINVIDTVQNIKKIIIENVQKKN